MNWTSGGHYKEIECYLYKVELSSCCSAGVELCTEVMTPLSSSLWKPVFDKPLSKVPH